MRTRRLVSERNAILAWHFLPDNRRLRYGDRRLVTRGRALAEKRHSTPRLCHAGLHASRRLLDALEYAPGPVLSQVEVWGEVEFGGDKLAGMYRRCLWWVNLRPVLGSIGLWVEIGTDYPLASAARCIDDEDRPRWMRNFWRVVSQLKGYGV